MRPSSSPEDTAGRQARLVHAATQRSLKVPARLGGPAIRGGGASSRYPLGFAAQAAAEPPPVMTIDWASFTPWSAAIGGVIIGVAVAGFALFNGRVAGISGIAGGMLKPSSADLGWRAAFVIGLVAAPAAYGLFATLPRRHDRRRLSAAGWRRTGRRHRHALWRGVHERPWRLRNVAAVAPRRRRDDRLHGGRLCNGVRRPPRHRSSMNRMYPIAAFVAGLVFGNRAHRFGNVQSGEGARILDLFGAWIRRWRW